MATGTVPRNYPLQLFVFSDMADTISAANLVSCLNSNNSWIPNGASAVQVGASANANRCLVLIMKAATAGQGFTVSPYADLNGLNLTYSGSTWAVAT